MAEASSDGAGATRAAIATLYETHFERVARYIVVRIGNYSDAEDLAGEVFVRALRSAATYKETGAPLEAWLFRIAHNMVVDHLRRKGRRPASVPLDEAFGLGSHDNPGEDLERQQDVAELQQALASLSAAQRQVLAMRFGGELSSEEVAAAMGKKPGAVREMQSAAVKKLRDVLLKQRSLAETRRNDA